MFEITSLAARFIFALIIYVFIFGIIRLIYLDIRSVNTRSVETDRGKPYLKLINQRETLDFKVEEVYVLVNDAVIGRSDKNHIIIRDPFMSKNHARISIREGEYYLSDLESKNGVYINGNRMSGQGEVCLKSGDKIGMGQLEFLFVEGLKNGV